MHLHHAFGYVVEIVSRHGRRRFALVEPRQQSFELRQGGDGACGLCFDRVDAADHASERLLQHA